MARLDTYRLRNGSPLPVLEEGTTATASVMYTFGSECQEIVTCANTNDVAKSDEFCLFNTDENSYWSANYSALPTKVNGRITYNSVIQKKPRLSRDTNACPQGGNCSLISF